MHAHAHTHARTHLEPERLGLKSWGSRVDLRALVSQGAPCACAQKMKEGRGRERETSQCGMGRYGLPVSMPKGLRVDALMQAACPPARFSPSCDFATVRRHSNAIFVHTTHGSAESGRRQEEPRQPDSVSYVSPSAHGFPVGLCHTYIGFRTARCPTSAAPSATALARAHLQPAPTGRAPIRLPWRGEPRGEALD